MSADQALRKLSLDPALYPGGVGIWGSLDPIYDTTSLPREHGVHVHARKVERRKKSIDESFDEVEVLLPSGASVTIREAEATPYVGAAVLELPLDDLQCPYCSQPHLDESHFSVHPHQRHQCQACGGEFLLGNRAIGNPIIRAKRELGDAQLTRQTIPGKKLVRLDQAADHCSGGVRIWGSNPAILWTAQRHEEAGIHVHAYRKGVVLPTVDNTFQSVEIDGVVLSATMVRLFMIQRTLSHLQASVAHVKCATCGVSHLDQMAPFAVEPHRNHDCHTCGRVTTTPNAVVSNPIVEILPMLYAQASLAGLERNPSSR